MRTSHQRSAFRLFKILVSLVFFITGADSVMAACPSEILAIPGFAENALGECVLTANVKLKHTLTLSSNTTLNCQSFILAPITKPRQGTDVTLRSNPEVAIFLDGDKDGAQNILIKNCRIFGFDFGIFAINSKRSPGSATPPIRILNNRVIEARFVDISLMSVDDAEIKGNSLIVRRKGGRGLYVGRNSDRNRILGNSIKVIIPTTIIPIGNTQTVRVPGPVDAGGGGVLVDPGTNPLVSEGSAVLITQTEGPEPILLNAIIEGKLHQLVFKNPTARADFSEDNIFDGNTVLMLPGTAVDGVVLAVPEGTRVSKNSVTGAKNSIRVGIQTGSKRFPGQCTGTDPERRFCYVNADCEISGLTPLPTCTLVLPHTESLSWLSPDTTIQDNQIRGTFDNGIGTLGLRSIITHNSIIGVLRNSLPSPGGGIVLVGFFPIEGTTGADAAIVTRNTVRTLTPLLLSQDGLLAKVRAATKFRAKIGLNDFTGYKAATQAVFACSFGSANCNGAYDIVTELSALIENSVIFRGNYWGTSCSIGLDPSAIKPPNLTITDKHPFGTPVANSPGLTPCF
jgi:hypothetical protein